MENDFAHRDRKNKVGTRLSRQCWVAALEQRVGCPFPSILGNIICAPNVKRECSYSQTRRNTEENLGSDLGGSSEQVYPKSRVGEGEK